MTIPRTKDGWNVMVDMFFYRDPEEMEKKQQEANLLLNRVPKSMPPP
jgi:hypothetical protein